MINYDTSTNQLPLFDGSAELTAPVDLPQEAAVPAAAASGQPPTEKPDEIDRLVDQGYNYTEARLMLGKISVPAKVTPRRRPQQSRRGLSPGGLLIADNFPPDHIRAQMGRR